MQAIHRFYQHKRACTGLRAFLQCQARVSQVCSSPSAIASKASQGSQTAKRCFKKIKKRGGGQWYYFPILESFLLLSLCKDSETNYLRSVNDWPFLLCFSAALCKKRLGKLQRSWQASKCSCGKTLREHSPMAAAPTGKAFDFILFPLALGLKQGFFLREIFHQFPRINSLI